MLPKTRQMSPYIWLLLVLLALIWGGAFFFARIAVVEIPPLTLVLARVFLAALTLNLFLLWTNTGQEHSPRLWLQFAMMGLLNNVIPFSLLFYGQQELGAGLASIVNALTPMWSLLIAHVTTSDERLSGGKVFGVLAGFTGVGIMLGGALINGLEDRAFALLAVVSATVSYGMASVWGRMFSAVSAMGTARGQLSMSSLMILPFTLFFDQPWQLPVPSMQAVGAVILLATVCTAFAYILFFKILASAGAVNISLVTLLVPVSAIFLGIVFLGELLLPRHAIGFGFILVGLLAIDGRPIIYVREFLGKYRF